MKPLRILTLFALGLALGLSASRASAQDSYADYNTQRAYRHFQKSPYSFRTYSSPDSVRVWGYDTPLESGRFYRTTGSYYEEISPNGRWSTGTPAQAGGSVVRHPVLVYPPVLPPRYLYP